VLICFVFFVTQIFQDLFHQLSTISVIPAQLNKRSAQQRLAEVCWALQNTSFDYAWLQCWLSHSWYHASHIRSIGRSAGMLGYRLWLHGLTECLQLL